MQVTPVAVGCLETQATDDRLGLQPRIKRHTTLGWNFGFAGIEKVAIQLKSWIIQFKGGGAGVL
ncbi:hypothetical protein KPSA1_00086 [Pseudomonas syringae pv. actinidiae]|uniref:Uncharacterized protein n=1 Tax=Pseudomonas syringae pv. actinidiae TaxID=103796 RepID=A0A2V0Q946_PSESF|nr:hypothetical protein KPSA1_00086 [Pseudomonas syringae pv. actinidiae]